MEEFFLGYHNHLTILRWSELFILELMVYFDTKEVFI